ncbi:MAG: cadherin-like beta sandwich domain-containing protein [Verrucomicrobiae bacterium]|nr:cadherin-like beta sandwich domain-containing protein [Verrucomicrobiae bacterium]
MKTYHYLFSFTLSGAAFLAGLALDASAQTYQYDSSGRLERVLYPDGKGVVYTYDIRDNMTRLNPITVPSAVKNLQIVSVPGSKAELSWDHSGSGSGFLIQSRLAGTDQWIDGATVGAGKRSATVSNIAREDLFLRVVVLGSTPDLQSTPSTAVHYPSGVALVVTTLADENDRRLGAGAGDSLREVIDAAYSGDLIGFAPVLSGQTIELAGMPLRVNKSITIDASPLPDKITISGGDSTRVFTLSGGGSVTMNGLTISQGRSSLGAGIHNDGVALTLRRCLLTRNESSDKGGGLYSFNDGSLTVMDGTVFNANTAADSGGGIHIEGGGTLSVNGATFRDNTAEKGGAIFNLGSLLDIGYASFSSNGADSGGAIFNQDASGVILNCTLALNGANGNTGGGVANEGEANLILRHSTLAANVGAGVANVSPAALTLDNSIVSGNFSVANDPLDFQGDYTAIGANLVRTHSGSRTGGPAPLTSDPLLGELRSGVMALLVGSPAIDSGVTTANTPGTDQERSSRPFAQGPDLGSVESKLSADVDLLWLTTSAGQLTPRFDATVTDYAASVPDSALTAAVRGAKVRNNQTMEVRINGGAFTTVNSKEASSDLPLNSGINTIEVKVTAPNGTTTQSYNIVVTRGESNTPNPGVTSLVTSNGTLSPDFRPGVTDYHMVVPSGTDFTTVTAPPGTAGSSVGVRVNFGESLAVPSGAPSPNLPLHVGENTIEVVVTDSEGATTESYTLTATRDEPAPSNASLASLTTNAGMLSPAFSSAVFYYHASVKSDVTTATVTPTSVEAGAAIAVRANGGAFAPAGSGAASAAQALNLGPNPFEVKVTAPDGTTSRVYTVIITRLNDGVEWASEPGGGNSNDPALSADCRFVAFSSQASNLVAGDTNNQEDIFVFDRTTKTVERVSVSIDGAQGNAASFNPSISGDGRYVVFESEASNLVTGDTNGQNDKSKGSDIFVFDRTTRMIERVSLRDDGGQSNQASRSPSISADGRYVAFQSGANNLIAGFRNGQTNVYVRDRVENTIVGVYVPFAVIPSNRASLNPVISADGNYVAFEFTAGVNDGNRSFKYTDIYLFNRGNRAVERVTGTKVGILADGTESKSPSISADGRYVAFQSKLEDLDFYDVNFKRDVFVYDRVTGFTQSVSSGVDPDEKPFQDAINPSISGNGRYVAFDSRYAHFVPSDTAGRVDVFVKDLQTGEITRRSASATGEEGSGDSQNASLSFDGQCVAFESISTNLVDAEPSGQNIFVSFVDAPEASSLADLGSLTSNLGTISPQLNPEITSYHASIPEELDSALVRPVAADLGALVEASVNSRAFQALPPEGVFSLALEAGSNTVAIRVTAADDSTVKSYALTIDRAAALLSNDAALAGLVPSGGALEPAFTSGTAAYSMMVANATSSITLTPTAVDSKATVTVNGESVTSGAASSAIPLNVGSNTVITTVIAEDGVTTQSYVLSIAREASAADRNADLAALTSSAGAFTPAFSSEVTVYEIDVPNTTASLSLMPTVAQGAATVTVQRRAVASGSASEAFDLEVGSNTIIVEVTAPDRFTKKAYVLIVTRAAPLGLSSNANLASLFVSAGTLSPAFNQNVLSYSLSVASSVSRTRVIPTLADANAAVTINGTAVSSGSASGELALQAGSNTITVLVSAEDGSMKTYTVTVTKASEPVGALEISDVAFIKGAPSKLSITWKSQSGVVYVVEQSLDLKLWTPLGGDRTGAASNTTVELEIPAASRDGLFLRARQK